MKKENNFYWIIFIVLALIVGYLIGSSITGNLIRAPAEPFPTYPQADGGTTYATYGGVLGMLTSCNLVEPVNSSNMRCSNTCEAQEKTALGAYTAISYNALKQDGQIDLQMVSDFVWGDNQILPSCNGFPECGENGDVAVMLGLENQYNATTMGISNMVVRSKCVCCSAP